MTQTEFSFKTTELQDLISDAEQYALANFSDPNVHTLLISVTGNQASLASRTGRFLMSSVLSTANINIKKLAIPFSLLKNKLNGALEVTFLIKNNVINLI
ncbi:hypothetical protein [Photobacterium sp. GB-72]|uniref:hypothetical protein n=1 Tax=Photobacterium sp. GB-72 TaxID=2022105 RepID=UPI000D157F4A|nr:hypothetical protein [Photobacterium sp. GB-72]PSV28047.1 hypothetical protein C9J40_19400 [Photobacterium sp. GB-72]